MLLASRCVILPKHPRKDSAVRHAFYPGSTAGKYTDQPACDGLTSPGRPVLSVRGTGGKGGAFRSVKSRCPDGSGTFFSHQRNLRRWQKATNPQTSTKQWPSPCCPAGAVSTPLPVAPLEWSLLLRAKGPTAPGIALPFPVAARVPVCGAIGPPVWAYSSGWPPLLHLVDLIAPGNGSPSRGQSPTAGARGTRHKRRTKRTCLYVTANRWFSRTVRRTGLSVLYTPP